ncbi:hypothetical protein MTO96_029943 [Rhipicephalus appendiculatus]
MSSGLRYQVPAAAPSFDSFKKKDYRPSSSDHAKHRDDREDGPSQSNFRRPLPDMSDSFMARRRQEREKIGAQGVRSLWGESPDRPLNSDEEQSSKKKPGTESPDTQKKSKSKKRKHKHSKESSFTQKQKAQEGKEEAQKERIKEKGKETPPSAQE